MKKNTLAEVYRERSLEAHEKSRSCHISASTTGTGHTLPSLSGLHASPRSWTVVRSPALGLCP